MDAHRAEIDELNVFPVPDGDTGTNLSLTLRAAAEALAADPADTAGEAFRAWAKGAVLGARGNSGVIVSQVLCGLADGIDGSEACDGSLLAVALRSAADQAYASVANPVEGTILSVARAAADAGWCWLDSQRRAARSGGGLGSVAPHHRPAARVDPGRRGRCGRPRLGRADRRARRSRDRDSRRIAPSCALRAFPNGASKRPANPAAPSTTTRCSTCCAPTTSTPRSFGRNWPRSVTRWSWWAPVTGCGTSTFTSTTSARPSRPVFVRVSRIGSRWFDSPTPWVLPHRRCRGGRRVPRSSPSPPAKDWRTCSRARASTSSKAARPRTRRPRTSCQPMLACPADHVVLLPNASQVGGVAEAAAIEARSRGIEVAVVPTKSPVQGLSAVAVHDASRHFGDDVIAMAEAAAATRWAEVTIAQREALTMAGRCQPGDVLGLIDGEVVEIGSTVGSVAAAIIDRLLAVGGELITILVGRDAEPDAGEQLRRHIASVAPACRGGSLRRGSAALSVAHRGGVGAPYRPGLPGGRGGRRSDRESPRAGAVDTHRRRPAGALPTAPCRARRADRSGVTPGRRRRHGAGRGAHRPGDSQPQRTRRAARGRRRRWRGGR